MPSVPRRRPSRPDRPAHAAMGLALGLLVTACASAPDPAPQRPDGSAALLAAGASLMATADPPTPPGAHRGRIEAAAARIAPGGPFPQVAPPSDTVPDRGRETYEAVCAGCHTWRPPPNAAPPMLMIARHYGAAHDDRAAARRAVVEWVRAPDASRSLLPAHAVERFGLMPPHPLPEDLLGEVADYVFRTLDAEGTPGMGRGGHGMARGGRGMRGGGGGMGHGGAGMGQGRAGMGAGGMGQREPGMGMRHRHGGDGTPG